MPRRCNEPVLALERIIESKKAANRPKDEARLPILKDLAQTFTFTAWKQAAPGKHD